MGGKVQDIKVLEKDGKGQTCPLQLPSQRYSFSQEDTSGHGGWDHLTAEYYTMLGVRLVNGGEHYWEVHYEPDSKAFGLGVAYCSLGHFQQLGKTAGPGGCSSTPGCGVLPYKAHIKQLLHTFKAKFTQPLLPAFSLVWQLPGDDRPTGPSFVRFVQKRGRATSSSNTGLT